MGVTTVERAGTVTSVVGAAARRMAAITAAGAVLGLLIGGAGGRLAMLLLAQLNPRVAGVTSDDGFVIGQFTWSGTLSLLSAGIALGVLGAAIYAVLRPLIFGPRWFQVLAMGVGPAVVVGEQLVHVDGVDFRLLGPRWLSIVLFLAIPGLYAALLTVVAETWLAPGGFFARGRAVLALAPLLVVPPFTPVLAGLALAWAALDAVRRRYGRVPFAAPAAWAGRAALVGVFSFAAVRLAEEVRLLL